MAQDSGIPSAPGPRSSLSWFQAWQAGLNGDFEYLFYFSNAKIGQAVGWVMISAAAGALIRLLLEAALYRRFSMLASAPGLMLLTALGESMLAVLGLLLGAGLIQVVARDIGGGGTYAELVYTTAAFTAPLRLISNVLAPMPVCVYLTIPLGLYGLFLQLKAIKAVHSFDWVSAIASLALILLLTLVAVAILLLLGPVVGRVFMNIVEGLATPMP